MRCDDSVVSAMTSLLAAVFTVMRSCLVVAALYGFCYAGVRVSRTSAGVESCHILLRPSEGKLVEINWGMEKCQGMFL